MTVKFIEIRDRGTFVPALAQSISGADGFIARRAGFGDQPLVLLTNLVRLECQYDPYSWSRGAMRTMHVAHLWLQEHFDEVTDGAVVDVEFILGESAAPKVSERKEGE